MLPAACLLALAFLFGPTNLSAQSPGRPDAPELIIGIAPTKAHVQQKIVQLIRLESPFPFDGLQVDLGTPQGADALTLQAPNIRPFENWDVSGYVYETSRALFVNDAGTFSVPPVTARGLTTNAAGIQREFEKTWPGQTISVAPPETALINEPWLVANSVRMSEAWSRHPDLLKVGEVATRTITVTATGARAEQIDAPVMSLGTGVQTLAGQTIRSNEVTDNEVIGTLTQEFEVRIASEQLSDIAPVALAWWDATAQRSRSTAVRGWRIEPVLPERSALVNSLLEQAHLRQDRSRAILLLGVLPALVLLLLLKLALQRFPAIGSAMQRSVAWISDRLLGPSQDLPDIGFSRIRSQPPANRSSQAHSEADD